MLLSLLPLLEHLSSLRLYMVFMLLSAPSSGTHEFTSVIYGVHVAVCSLFWNTWVHFRYIWCSCCCLLPLLEHLSSLRLYMVFMLLSAPSSGTPEFTSVIYGVHVAQSAPSSGTPEFTSVIYGVHVAVCSLFWNTWVHFGYIWCSCCCLLPLLEHLSSLRLYMVFMLLSAPSSGTPEFTSVIYGVHVAVCSLFWNTWVHFGYIWCSCSSVCSLFRNTWVHFGYIWCSCCLVCSLFRNTWVHFGYIWCSCCSVCSLFRNTWVHFGYIWCSCCCLLPLPEHLSSLRLYMVFMLLSAPSSGTPEFTSVIYGVHVAVCSLFWNTWVHFGYIWCSCCCLLPLLEHLSSLRLYMVFMLLSLLPFLEHLSSLRLYMVFMLLSLLPLPEHLSSLPLYMVFMLLSAPSSGTPEFTSVIYGVHVAVCSLFWNTWVHFGYIWCSCCSVCSLFWNTWVHFGYIWCSCCCLLPLLEHLSSLRLYMVFMLLSAPSSGTPEFTSVVYGVHVAVCSLFWNTWVHFGYIWCSCCCLLPLLEHLSSLRLYMVFMLLSAPSSGTPEFTSVIYGVHVAVCSIFWNTWVHFGYIWCSCCSVCSLFRNTWVHFGYIWCSCCCLLPLLEHLSSLRLYMVFMLLSAPSSGTPEFTSVIYDVHVAQSAPSSGTPEFTSVIYGVHVAVCSLFWNTWVHFRYIWCSCCSVCSLFRNTWVHFRYIWCSCCSVFSFPCSVL